MVKILRAYDAIVNHMAKVLRGYGAFVCNYVCSNGRLRVPRCCQGDTFMAPPQLNPRYATGWANGERY